MQLAARSSQSHPRSFKSAFGSNGLRTYGNSKQAGNKSALYDGRRGILRLALATKCTEIENMVVKAYKSVYMKAR